MKISGIILFWAVAVTSVVFLTALAISIELDHVFPLINSDTLFFHLLFHDLITLGNNLKGWDLNTTFNLVPNAIMYFFAYLVSSNPFINMLLHGIFQYSIFFSALFWFYRSYRPAIPWIWHLPGLILLHVIFINAHVIKEYLLFTFFVHPFHFGAFILFYVLSAAMHDYMHHPTRRLCRIIFLISMLGAFSNLMLIIMFTLPWLGASFIAFYKKHFPGTLFLRLNAIALGGAFAGIMLFVLAKNLRIITFTRKRLLSWDNVISSYNIMIESYMELFTQSVFMMFTGVMFIVTFIFMLMWSIHYLVSKPGLTDSDGFIFNNWILVNLIFTLAVFFAPIANGIVYEFYEIRYNFFILLIPFVNLGIISFYFLRNAVNFSKVAGWVALGMTVIFVAGVAIFIVMNPMEKRFLEKQNYYPHEARVMDELYELYDLKNGIGNFWDAKLVYVFSDNNIRLRQVYHGTDLYALGSPRSWYFPQKNEDPVPVFNFILYRESVADMETLNNLFGKENLSFVEREGLQLILVPEFTYSKKGRVVLIKNLESSASIQE
jgi:hypothetical protein